MVKKTHIFPTILCILSTVYLLFTVLFAAFKSQRGRRWDVGVGANSEQGEVKVPREHEFLISHILIRTYFAISVPKIHATRDWLHILLNVFDYQFNI